MHDESSPMGTYNKQSYIVIEARKRTSILGPLDQASAESLQAKYGVQGEELLEAREAVRISEVADKVREEEAEAEAIERAQSEAVSQLEKDDESSVV